MDKTAEELLKDFKKELNDNDKKVKQEINNKDRVEMSKEFAEFIEKNKCKKLVGGGKNGKK